MCIVFNFKIQPPHTPKQEILRTAKRLFKYVFNSPKISYLNEFQLNILSLVETKQGSLTPRMDIGTAFASKQQMEFKSSVSSPSWKQ